MKESDRTEMKDEGEWRRKVERRKKRRGRREEG